MSMILIVLLSVKNVSYQKAKLLFSSLDYRHETGFWGIGMNNELFLAYSMNRKYLTKKRKNVALESAK